MYLRADHREKDVGALLAFIKANPLGLLTTAISSPNYPLIQASHVPLVLDVVSEDESAPVKGRLRGHITRQNPQAKAFVEQAAANESASATHKLETEVMVLFNGINHYVTPKFYTETKPSTGKVVPTWNYSAVEVYGKLTIYHDGKAPECAEFLQKQISDLSLHCEKEVSGHSQPWTVDEAPEKYVDILKKAIMGIEIEIERIGGKYKMSQEMGSGDRQGVVEGFRKLDTTLGGQVADLVEERGKLKDEAKARAQVAAPRVDGIVIIIEPSDDLAFINRIAIDSRSATIIIMIMLSSSTIAEVETVVLLIHSIWEELRWATDPRHDAGLAALPREIFDDWFKWRKNRLAVFEELTRRLYACAHNEAANALDATDLPVLCKTIALLTEGTYAETETEIATNKAKKKKDRIVTDGASWEGMLIAMPFPNQECAAYPIEHLPMGPADLQKKTVATWGSEQVQRHQQQMLALESWQRTCLVSMSPPCSEKAKLKITPLPQRRFAVITIAIPIGREGSLTSLLVLVRNDPQ